MNKAEFKEQAYKMVDWMVDYMEDIEAFPVKSQVEPGEILSKIPVSAPSNGESFDQILADFDNDILPGITHWQHPSFFAYFPASSSDPSVLAEMMTATIGAQCMMWATSPAAAEMEERMMEWLRDMLKLPREWHGVIQDTASTATLVAMLSAREQKSEFSINEKGFNGQRYTLYCSEQTHSSVEKAVGMAGFGKSNLRKIKCDSEYAMIPNELINAIEDDLNNGFEPLFVCGALGTTGSTAIDPIDKIGEIAQKYKLWYHIDAAYAGSALVLDDFRNRFSRFELADSFVFNPHKWFFTNFDCSAYYVRDKETLIKTFTLTPEYLKTQEEDRVNNYKDWGIQLGRRFRALKLWFVLRSFGTEEIKSRIQEHIDLGQWFANQVKEHPDFELLAPVPLNTVCFRYNPGGLENDVLNDTNERLMHALNNTGKLYLTHTKLDNDFSLRLVTGTSRVRKDHVENAWKMIRETAKNI